MPADVPLTLPVGVSNALLSVRLRQPELLDRASHERSVGGVTKDVQSIITFGEHTLRAATDEHRRSGLDDFVDHMVGDFDESRFTGWQTGR